MTLKTLLLTVSLIISLSQSWSQTKADVKFTKGSGIDQSKEFRFYFQVNKDTIDVFKSSVDHERENVGIYIPPCDTAIAIFEFKTKSEVCRRVEQIIAIDKGLKRIEIELYFSNNDKKVEYLKDFTVDKFFNTNSVSIQRVFVPKIGTQPMFRLVNSSDTTFWGCNETNHFYGTISSKQDWGLGRGFSGSYCVSTVPEKPLAKTDTAYSWIPNYNYGDEYKIRGPGTYLYSVKLGLERHSDGIPMTLIEQAETRKRTRVFCEVETEFTVK